MRLKSLDVIILPVRFFVLVGISLRHLSEASPTFSLSLLRTPKGFSDCAMTRCLFLVSFWLATSNRNDGLMTPVFGQEVVPDLPSSYKSTVQTDLLDPALEEIDFDVGTGPQKWHVYKEPNVTNFYLDECPASTKVKPQVRKVPNVSVTREPFTIADNVSFSLHDSLMALPLNSST